MIWIEFYILFMQLFLAGKDATSYLLKAKSDDSLSGTRVKRWHRDGVVIFCLSILPVIYIEWVHNHSFYLTTAFAVLIRLAVFDISFNKWAGLQWTSLGSTAWTDQQFVKIFGGNGALKKSLVFLALLTALNYVAGHYLRHTVSGFYWGLF